MAARASFRRTSRGGSHCAQGTAVMRVALTDSELLAFCGLVRWLVRLDGQISAEERMAVEEIGPGLAMQPLEIDDPYRDHPGGLDDGVDRFWDMMDRAAATFDSGESVQRAALGVVRKDAQEAILAALFELAACDVISKPEWSLLDWLSRQWGVALNRG